MAYTLVDTGASLANLDKFIEAHAQTGDRPHPIGVTDRGVPHDRCAPVVANQHDRLIEERGGDRSDVARELA
jgi:hypothetical protein